MIRACYKIYVSFLLLVVLSLISCSRNNYLDGTYGGKPGSPKIITEGLTLRPDFSFLYKSTIYDIGTHGTSIQYVGSYQLIKNEIVFNLDSIKTHLLKLYKPNEPRVEPAFSNFIAKEVTAEEQDLFNKGEYRLKPKYTTNKSRDVLMVGLAERFVLLKPFPLIQNN